MSDSRSSTTVTIAAGCSTRFACSAVSSQRIDSRSSSGRWLGGIGLTPSRVQICPPTSPRQAPLLASSASIECTSNPYARPFFTGPSPRRRCAVVGNFTSQVSSTPNTCRPAHAAPVWPLQPSMIFAVVTCGLAKNRPTRSSPARLPPNRLRHTVLSATIASTIAAPFYRGADLRMSRASCPWRHLSPRCRAALNLTPTASR
jgi:hypothetical protein